MPTIYRVPTEHEMAAALRYIEAEFVIHHDGAGQILLDEVHWTEGLAYGPSRNFAPEPHHFQQARESMPQLTEFQWCCLAAAADRERASQGMPTIYSTYR